MKIVADANIPYVEEAFGKLGQVTLLPGREIGPMQVRDADVLIVRSVTPVGPLLLEGSRVRFVGSATIGLDHVDEAYLCTRGIAFAYAPGSNANSVAEYVIAALLALGRERYEGRTLGIIGIGRSGTLVQGKVLALGMTVLANDPPLERAGRAGLVSLEELLRRSDIVTCHVPLTREGPDATFHLLDEARLSRLQPHAVVINTARGAVVDNAALLRALRGGRLGGAVLDVWEHEPEPDPALVEAVTLGTPHIAGYSFDGKVNGTRMLYDAVCAFLEPARERSFPTVPSERHAPPVEIEADASLDDILQSLVGKAYDIRRDDAALRACMRLPRSERARAFDRLRAEYPIRLEFRHTTVAVPPNDPHIRKTLRGLGFTVEDRRA
jgi:erythronate-4-phosphate dehydrogenase